LQKQEKARVDNAGTPAVHEEFRRPVGNLGQRRQKSEDFFSRRLGDRMLPRREANFRRVLGVLFEGMRIDTPLPEDFRPIGLAATSAEKPRITEAMHLDITHSAIDSRIRARDNIPEGSRKQGSGHNPLTNGKTARVRESCGASLF
jgi:hypothetical protein